MQLTSNCSTAEKIDVTDSSQVKLAPTDDFADILKHFGLKYKRSDYYLDVGEPTWTHGWVLDISIIVSQVIALLEVVIPVLIRECIAFKIARSSRKTQSIVNGEYGWFLLGKVISIFPSDEKHAMELATKLIETTAHFKGPEIVTDRRLSSIIYARYGAIKGDASDLTIPFRLPDGINWPFAAIASFKEPKRETVLQDRYKPIFMLKEDTKGTVRKGLWLKKLYQIKWCIIKEGRQNMVSDFHGRDMRDRLRWQYELHNNLKGIVPLPKIYDFFEENGDSYLVMEYIRGTSLHKKIESVFAEKTWDLLTIPEKTSLLQYARQVLNIIENMHKRGYVHRDITTNNFLVDKNEQLWMIDLELSYCLKSPKSSSPFRLGTPGFMSPEQVTDQLPTTEQDVFAIGALLLETLTAKHPDYFLKVEKLITSQQLEFFINDPELADVLGDCTSADPRERPTISALRQALINFEEREKSALRAIASPRSITRPEKDKLEEFINRALEGLVRTDMVNQKNLWVSKGSGEDGSNPSQVKPLAVNEGWLQGVSGVVWLLSRAYSLGFTIEPCMESFTESVAYIRSQACRRTKEADGGLYFGTAGMAIALTTAINCGLIDNTEALSTEIISCLRNNNVNRFGVVRGLAGQGIAMLHSALSLDRPTIRPLLEENIQQLIKHQEVDGSWTAVTDRNRRTISPTGFGHGVAGIVCFLLCYLKNYEDNAQAKYAVHRALEWLIHQCRSRKGIARWTSNNKSKLCLLDFQDGCMGIILCLVKAYEIFGKREYRELAESCLKNYPPYKVSWDLTLATGLAGYGEVYLEAAKTFGGGEWQKRADWIAQYLVHYYKQDVNRTYFWEADGSQYPTADLLSGNCGVIHFLLRYSGQGNIPHPLLSC